MRSEIPLLFRADAGTEIGTGHVMRCLALAQAWQDIGGEAVFALAEGNPEIRERLSREGMAVVQLTVSPGSMDDAHASVRLAQEHGAAWVVVDGYQFGADYHAVVKSAQLKLLLIDDNGNAGPYLADLLLNQNPHACEGLYDNKAPQVQLLLGPRFCLLRREFAGWRDWQREIQPRVRKILVTMGGSDAENLTLRVIDAIRTLGQKDLETTVVAGGSNPHFDVLESAVRDVGSGMSLVRNVSSMPPLLVAADLAVAGAGTTCWEICLLGLPALLCVLADNQEDVASALESRGIARSLGRSSQISADILREQLQSLSDAPETRREMGKRGRALVDGLGAARVVALLQGSLQLRRASFDDCRFLWDMANDPLVRATSFSSRPISWASHVAWFHARLADPNAILYTATHAGEGAIGQVRFQQTEPRATLSIGLGRAFRGRGMGRTLLFLACERLFLDSKVEVIDAFVKPDNDKSARLFSSAGFARLGIEPVDGKPAIHFVLERSHSK